MSDPRKAPLDLVPMRALMGAARVFETGNSKPDRQPGDWIRREMRDVFAALLRHTSELQTLNGETDPDFLAGLDEDSKLPTIDHVITNAIMLRSMLMDRGLLEDDPKTDRRGWLCTFTLASKPQPAPEGVQVREWTFKPGDVEIRSPGGTAWVPVLDTNEPGVVVVPVLDPDAERKAQTDREIMQRAEEARALAEAKRKHEQRCTNCNGTALTPDRSQCTYCKGTGQRNGSEGIKW